MKKTLFILLSMLTLSLARGEEKNLLRNGNFDDGYGKWTGERKIETIEDNKVAVVEVGSKEKSFRQPFRAQGLHSVHISFQVKASSDYKGKGFQLQVYRHEEGLDSWTYWTIPIPKNGEWKKIERDYSKFQKDGEYYFKIAVTPGKGKLYFDDFVVTPE